MKTKITVLWFICFVLLTFLCGFLYIQKDHEPPEIQFSKDDISYTKGEDEEILLYGVTATDNKDGDVTNRIHLDGYTILTGDKNISVDYVVRDRAGNVSSVSRIIPYEAEPDFKNKSKKSIEEHNADFKNSTIMVLNGTEIEGLAASWKDSLVKAGYKNVEIGNYSGTVGNHTTIYTSEQAAGEELLEIFPTGEIIKDNPSDKVTSDAAINLDDVEVFIVIGNKDADI